MIELYLNIKVNVYVRLIAKMLEAKVKYPVILELLFWRKNKNPYNKDKKDDGIINRCFPYQSLLFRFSGKRQNYRSYFQRHKLKYLSPSVENETKRQI